MKKAAAVLLLAVTGVLLYGCSGRSSGGGGFQPESSSIYISRDGKVLSALVEPYSLDNDEEKLKTFLDGEIARYGQENPGQGEQPSVSLKECSIKDGIMKAVFEYGSPEDMISFAVSQQDESIGLASLEVKEISEALSAGDISGNFRNRENETVSSEEVGKASKARAVVVSGEALIQTEGKILYVSEGVELTGTGNTARVTGEKSCIVFK
ncbi:hypothetical protein AALB16_03155 [Lachnospiraceae bacterium 62-35]